MKDNVLEKKPEVYRPPSQRKTSSSSLDYQVCKKFGDAGYRSRYLSHAKRALYHLSYTPFDFLNFKLLHFYSAMKILMNEIEAIQEIMDIQIRDIKIKDDENQLQQRIFQNSIETMEEIMEGAKNKILLKLINLGVNYR